jgi:hypothetical protein
LKWSVSVCGKAIDLEKIGLTNNFLITKGSIHGIKKVLSLSGQSGITC